MQTTRMKLTLIIGLLAPFFSFGQIFSNDVISANGEHTQSGSVSLTWTLGEVAITDYNHANGTFGEGFHQCFSCGAVAINELYTHPEIKSFPNPFTESISIQIENNTQMLYLQVVDALGNVVWTGTYSGNQIEEIDLTNLASGMYFLHVSTSTDLVSTTKIQKL